MVAYHRHLSFLHSFLDAAPSVHSIASIAIAIKRFALCCPVVRALDVIWFAPSLRMNRIILDSPRRHSSFRPRCRLRSFAFHRSCVGSTSSGDAFFLLHSTRCFKMLDVTIMTLIHKKFVSMLVLMPTFSTVAVERIRDGIRRYPSHNHRAPCISAPNFNSHCCSDIFRRQTINDPLSTKLVRHSRSSIDQRSVGKVLMSIRQ